MNALTLHTVRLLVVAMTLLAGSLAAAQGMQLQPGILQKPSAAVPLNAPLPANTPTSAPLPQIHNAPARSALHRARVECIGSLLTVTADNSSLNQILREISRQTGIQITGGVTDERVYGTYGPSDLPTILAVLLDGTGSNMMLSGDNPGQPKLLTLTPRQGGISPPSPSAFAADEPEPPQNLPPQQTPRTPSDNRGPTPADRPLAAAELHPASAAGRDPARHHHPPQRPVRPPQTSPRTGSKHRSKFTIS